MQLQIAVVTGQLQKATPPFIKLLWYVFAYFRGAITLRMPCLAVNSMHRVKENTCQDGWHYVDSISTSTYRLSLSYETAKLGTVPTPAYVANL